MDTNKLRMELSKVAGDARVDRSYRTLTFGFSKDDEKPKMIRLLLLDHDFVLGDKTQFTFDEAIQIQNAGREFGLRLLRAHEWRGLGFWITHNGEYHGVTEFNFVHSGHTWRGTNIPQTQDGGAYYWTGSSDKLGEMARAAKLLPSGQFDVEYRPRSEGMNVRLVIDDSLVPHRVTSI